MKTGGKRRHETAATGVPSMRLYTAAKLKIYHVMRLLLRKNYYLCHRYQH